MAYRLEFHPEAAAEFDEAALEKRPTVQVGDPFYEKLLLEACLEAMRAGAIVGIQDMGAAGLTSSSCEMGARAGTGAREVSARDRQACAELAGSIRSTSATMFAV